MQFMLKKLLKAILPDPLKHRLIAMRKSVRYTSRRLALRIAIQGEGPLKIIVGAAETNQKGWLSTNEQWLDITKEEDWKKNFGKKNLVSHIVAEHVFEHLTTEESIKALNNMFKWLSQNGKIRIAVPDGYNPNNEYIRHVCVEGLGDDAADHKQLLNVDSLTALMQKAGFTAQHIEGYNADGTLTQNRWQAEDGFIRRSRQNNFQDSWSFPDAATSLIVDGQKK